MVTIGDVFSIVASVAGICISAWALILAVALVFPSRTERARERVVRTPWAVGGIGLLIVFTLGLFSFILVAQPNPLGKLVGWSVMLGLLSVSALGSSGIAAHAADRLRTMAPDLTPYAAFSRSAAFVVISGILPILGWFLIVPILLVMSIGAGTLALLEREPVAVGPRFMP